MIFIDGTSAMYDNRDDIPNYAMFAHIYRQYPKLCNVDGGNHMTMIGHQILSLCLYFCEAKWIRLNG